MNKQTPLSLIRGDQLRPAMRILRALAHPLRLSIIRVIHENNGAANVGEIFTALNIEQSVASQHLRVLRHAELVKTRRDRKFIFYTLDYERFARTTESLTVLKDVD
ncbi:MAG: metalloregulator ArsR/SmtB family transcription factor [Saprospiraceae bacterium]|nr:metalloregulator ArsR/SmtB family transcription factor [Saprospiraceae bacterium]